MTHTVRARVTTGHLEPLEKIDLPEGEVPGNRRKTLLASALFVKRTAGHTAP